MVKIVSSLFSRMIRFLDVLADIFWIEPNVFELAGAIEGGLVGEVLGAGSTALASRHDRAGFYALAKLNNGDKTIAHIAVAFFRAGIRSGGECGQRSPGRGGEANRQAGLLVVVGLLRFPG